MTKPIKLITHEAFIQRIFALVLKRDVLTKDDRKALEAVRLTYGAHTENNMRGVTWHQKWDHCCNAHGERIKGRKPRIGALICVHGSGQADVVSLAGTTLHELAHAIAGPGAGHDATWKAACGRVGLAVALVGQAYTWDLFDPAMAKLIQALPVPNDGMPRHWRKVVEELRKKGGEGLPPALRTGPLPEEPRMKPCGAGFGVRGGTSRGKGAGSRMLKYTCEHKPGCDLPAVLRCAGTKLQVSCDNCKAPYKLDEASLPPSHGMGASGQGVPAATARKHGARKPRVRSQAALAKAKARRANRTARLNAQAPLGGPAPGAAPSEPQPRPTDDGGPHDHT